MIQEKITKSRNFQYQSCLQLSEEDISLSQIITQSEYNRLLKEESFSQEFSHFLLDDDHIQKQPKESNKAKINILNQALDIKSIDSSQKAYERVYMNKKSLLANPFFIATSSNCQTQIKQQHDYEQYSDYFTYYKKWKNQTKENSPIKLGQKYSLENNSKNQTFHDKKYQFVNLECKQTSKKSQQSFKESENLIELQLKKIHDEYLSKITEITRKNIDIPCLKHTEQNFSNNDEKSPKNESSISGKSVFNNINRDDPISQATSRIRPIEDDIHQYCFENMIKHKPLLIQNTNNQSIRDEYNLHYSPMKLDDNVIDNINQQQKLKHNFGNKSSQKYISNLSLHSQAQKQLQKQIHVPIVKLNIQKLLKLPYKEFILFFETNHNRIITLAKPEEYAELKRYQTKCLQHAESVEKLKSKFSSQNGAKLVKQLSLQQKEKLFRILYS